MTDREYLISQFAGLDAAISRVLSDAPSFGSRISENLILTVRPYNMQIVYEYHATTQERVDIVDRLFSGDYTLDYVDYGCSLIMFMEDRSHFECVELPQLLATVKRDIIAGTALNLIITTHNYKYSIRGGQVRIQLTNTTADSDESIDLRISEIVDVVHLHNGDINKLTP